MPSERPAVPSAVLESRVGFPLVTGVLATVIAAALIVAFGGNVLTALGIGLGVAIGTAATQWYRAR